MIPIYKIIKVYEYLYQRRYSQPDYTLPRSSRNLKLLGKFQKMIPVDSGDSFIWNYSVFGFWSYSNLLTRRPIELNWIYGGKMYSRYQQRTEEQIYYLQQYKESNAIKNPLKEKYNLSLSESYKNKQRKLYWKTMRGYLHCESFAGELYDPGNLFCKECQFKNHCQKDE